MTKKELNPLKEGYLSQWYKEIVKHKWLLLLALFLLVMSNIIGFYAGNYADKVCSNAVSDIILDHLPATDLSFLFVYGYTTIIAIFIFYPLFFRINLLHIAISQLSLVFIVRSFFIILTHLKMPSDIIPVSWPTLLAPIAFSNDLFFSGHTAISFLGFLVYRDSKIRWFFLLASLVMAFTVLAMHQHYSIDVFAAFFITFGVYKLGNWFFTKLQK